MNYLVKLFLAFVLTSCSNLPVGGCPDGEIEWIHAVKIKDVKYEHHFPEPHDMVELNIVQGDEIGKVGYKMADDACSNYKMKNGDATYLDEGTPIYSIKDTPTSLAVLANDQVFVVEQNTKAKTVGEYYPIKDLVKKIHIESTLDGRRLRTFPDASTKVFLDEWLALSLHDREQLAKDNKDDGESIFLEIELKNGITFRETYWRDNKTFHVGAVGTERLAETIEKEYSLIHK
ncbi:hypothetical protein AWM68_02620 [Fictibacillus phosphorivorans]|uniref:Uncharacterized protein n=1 Tax=Fictibacillus phosphorivorans TaxID=1221500 RepID=A0A165P6U2_9BACL|nr:hypothetical protein [Fictibacillus phosphorivorans]KZE69180.1 hypothetical protein AWM68_02620 [Fictibacillus phosphorivorans]